MNFNEQQLKAITSNERTILCLAGAGAGKTATMVNRIARLVKDGADPRSILVLTFTNAAAFEMEQRFKKMNICKGTAQPEFRTFHGFCYSLIIKDKAIRERLGYSKVPEICSDNKLKELEKTAKLTTGCKLTDDQIAGNKVLNKVEEHELQLFRKALAQLVKKENVITFDMLCYNVCALFETKHSDVEKYRNKYKHVIVDECQDSDPRQMKFIGSFPSDTNIYLTADALQSIYQFRGCTNEFVKTLAKAPGWEVIKLYKNYRSTRQICEFANNFSKYAKDEYRIEMEGMREGDPVKVVTGSHVSYDCPVDMGHLELCITSLKKHERESAILVRTNKEVQFICRKLDERNIPYTTSNKSTDNIDILESALDNNYAMEWLSTFLDTKEYSDYIRLKTTEKNADLQWFFNTYGNHSKVQKRGKLVVKIREIVHQGCTAQDKADAITKLLKIKENVEVQESCTNRQIVETIRDSLSSSQESRIYVGTVHSSKGLEYDTVYILGVNDGLFELGTEEMNNLYYVAITRAKNYLTVYKH